MRSRFAGFITSFPSWRRRRSSRCGRSPSSHAMGSSSSLISQSRRAAPTRHHSRWCSLVHGGPWARDFFGFNAVHQWLANRGYAVLSVNFRGSVGFGKAFVNAGDREWGRRMDDDLLDAVAWAIDQGYADPKRVAIMGGSYGGYATLVGLTRNPEVYACGIDIVGPSNLETLIRTTPPYWEVDPLSASEGDRRSRNGGRARSSSRALAAVSGRPDHQAAAHCARRE